jgi:AcrR family transcriptional regulator
MNVLINEYTHKLEAFEMPGLRQRKKEETRRNILIAARALFLQKGYAGATTSEIAALAGIAEGTIFNYFSSKAEILVSLFYQAFLRDAYIFGAFDGYSDNLVNEVVRFLDYYLSPAKEMQKSLLREVFSISFQYTSESRYIFQQMEELDRTIGRELKSYLSMLQKERVLSDQIDIDDFLVAFYGIVMYLFSKFVIRDEVSYEDLFGELRAKLGLLVRAVLLPSLPPENQV